MSGGFNLGTPQFLPSISLISSISRGSTTTVTTASDHGFSDGMVIRIVVPTDLNNLYTPTGVAGMTQINGLYGEITVIDATSFSIAIDSSSFDAFSIPSPWPAIVSVYPQAVPMGMDVTVDSSADATYNDR